MIINPNRIKNINNKELTNGKVIYWMSREQRVEDNGSLVYALNLAKSFEQELIVVFNIVPTFIGATLRQYIFMIEGLKQVEEKLNNLNIRFEILLGDPEENIVNKITKEKSTVLVTDYSPLKIYNKWLTDIQNNLDKNKLNKDKRVSIIQIDSHNIVPVYIASNKQEYSARTIRPKIHKLLDTYLVEFPKIEKQNIDLTNNKKVVNKNNWEEIYNFIKVDQTIKPVEWIKPGEDNALKMLKVFIENKLENYNELRNDPTKDYLSNMSPYLHFGQISAQRIALEITKLLDNKNKEHINKQWKESIEAYLEELIVRRELTENFCTYNKNYDSFEGISKWAQETLNKHRNDIREYVYTKKQLEEYKTHDDAWNACQKQMVIEGKMHGYMRMYWAKKILEWTKTPEEAIEIAIYLNDKYELDGRDPNGYVGILWAIGGVHDRPWFEREVYGTIRYMNYNGLKRKFKLDSYISNYK
jgi:deoxyribodipyrimidine photo-lyase